MVAGETRVQVIYVGAGPDLCLSLLRGDLPGLGALRDSKQVTETHSANLVAFCRTAIKVSQKCHLSSLSFRRAG